jgi:hypothetical protein
VSAKKKAAGKGKGTEKTSPKKRKPKTVKPVNMGQVRENINNLVGASARKIAIEVIKVAMTGQLATAKYLFEAVGLYPPTEETVIRPIETTLAHTLLTRMGLPLEPVICDEELAPAVAVDAKGVVPKATGAVDEDAEEEGDESGKTIPIRVEGE